ncbi:helix-turn-helix domain-containing protein [Kitasatospora purpeofusca]|uniref:helix-turn-helix domain-containing protein n=1 Tax=Kitasatospora purpeofusca TaxID=67352 RepID=UPI0035E0553F
MRATDALCGVLSGTVPEPARAVVANRLLLEIEQQLFRMSEVEALAEDCAAAVSTASADEWADDAAVRQWLAEVLHQHASEYNDHHDLDPGEWDHVDAADHPIWALLELSPFARRLRLLQDATVQTGAALGRAMGVGAHQLRHWAAGRSRPGDAERAAMAKVFGIHPHWLDAARDQEPDVELYRFRACPCANADTVTRGDLGPDEPSWYDSNAEQAAAARWCDGCGQPWLKDAEGIMLPLPAGEEEIPARGNLADTSHPAIYTRHRDLATPWPPALWRPPHHPLKRTSARTAYLVPALLAAAPQPVVAAPKAVLSPLPHYIHPDERVHAYADRCRSCRALLGAPAGNAGGSWVLLHRSERHRSLSTWSYPSRADALHTAAHMAIGYIGSDDVARDLFADQAHAQVLQRFWELKPETDVFEVAELVPMRSTEF